GNLAAKPTTRIEKPGTWMPNSGKQAAKSSIQARMSTTHPAQLAVAGAPHAANTAAVPSYPSIEQTCTGMGGRIAKFDNWTSSSFPGDVTLLINSKTGEMMTVDNNGTIYGIGKDGKLYIDHLTCPTAHRDNQLECCTTTTANQQ